VLTVSSSEMTLLMVLAVAEAVLGYVLSEADRRKLGRTPWGLPSLVWALLWFLSLVLGLVLYLVAHRAGVRRVAQAPSGVIDARGHLVPPSVSQRSTGSDFPAYPRPADGSASASPLPTPAPPAPLPTAGAASPSWQPDPSGRFHYRWWTGTEWTSHVATHGQMTVDTSPDQRIGPY